jgi:hypothetical protein
LGYVSPITYKKLTFGLGFFFAMAVLNNIYYDDFLTSTHLYYTRKIYYHKNLGSLEKMFKSKWYFNSTHTSPSNPGAIINYDHFN